MRVLSQVAALDLSDGWVAAGFVRNAVWDHLHGYADPTPVADVDVIYFDPRDTSADKDAHFEARLRASAPDVPWSVKNQARMHLRNDDQPYESTADALTCWPETCTAIAARSRPHGIEVLAPLGVRDLLGLLVRPTPRFMAKLDIYRERVTAKAWRERWPRLRIDHVG